MLSFKLLDLRMEVALLGITIGHQQPLSFLTLLLAPQGLTSLLAFGISDQSVSIFLIGIGIFVECLIVK